MIQMIMISLFFLLLFALYVFEVASLGKVFEKAGLPVWAILVPYYNTYLLYKAVWSKKAALYITILSIVAAVIGFIAVIALIQYSIQSVFNPSGATALGYTFVVCVILFAVLAFVLWYQGILQALYMAISFGQNWIFAFGLVFLPFIFIPMLAFSPDARYSGSAEDNSFSLEEVMGIRKTLKQKSGSAS